MQNLSEQQKFGEALPDFSLRTLDGEPANIGWVLGDNKPGENKPGKKKGAVMVVWSSTCSHCIRYDKYFNGFAEQYPDIGLLIVSSRNGEELDAVRRAAAQRKLKFPIAHDPASLVADKWFTRQTPRAFLIDAGGALLYRGAVDNYKYSDDPEYVAYLDPALQQYLQGKPIEKSETASYGCAIQSVYYTLPKAL